MPGRYLASAGEVFARSVGRSVGRHPCPYHRRHPRRVMDNPALSRWRPPCYFDLSSGQAGRTGPPGRLGRWPPYHFGRTPCVVVSYFPRVKRWIVFSLPLWPPEWAILRRNRGGHKPANAARRRPPSRSRRKESARARSGRSLYPCARRAAVIYGILAAGVSGRLIRTRETRDVPETFPIRQTYRIPKDGIYKRPAAGPHGRPVIFRATQGPQCWEPRATSRMTSRAAAPGGHEETGPFVPISNPYRNVAPGVERGGIGARFVFDCARKIRRRPGAFLQRGRYMKYIAPA